MRRRITTRRLAPRATIAALGLLLLGLPGSVDAAQLDGRIELVGKRGRRPPKDATPRFAVVSFMPTTPVPVQVPEEPFEVVTVRKAFTPRVLRVPQGSTVRFPNQDPILHNVFSVTPTQPFDLGLYRQGEGKSVTFEAPGVVRVFCNVHHAMVAYVVVLDTPFHTHPDGDGRFRLEGLPDGPGTLQVWHERAPVWSQEMVLPHDAPVEVQLTVSRPRIPRHLNKLGKPYARKQGERYR